MPRGDNSQQYTSRPRRRQEGRPGARARGAWAKPADDGRADR